MKATYGLLAASVALLALPLISSATVPEIKSVPSGNVLSALSNNGRWALSENTTEDSESGATWASGGLLWDLNDMSYKSISPASGVAGLQDVSDDGQIVVGSCDGVPAYWNGTLGQWHKLPVPDGHTGGLLLAVTPDGKKAVGYLNVTTEWNADAVLYDLEADEIIELPAMPTKDMNHWTTDYSAFWGISADGRYLMGTLSHYILMPVSMTTFIYDTETDTVDYIGFTPSDTQAWTPKFDNLSFIDAAKMSPSGTYVTGMGYIANPIQGSEYFDEYNTAFAYKVSDGTMELYNGTYDSDIAGTSITDDGVVLAASPAVNPYASMMVRSGKYYYSLDDIFTQAYGLNFKEMTGESNTGKPICVSEDGRTVVMLTGPSDTYVLKMPENWQDACSRVNLLKDYTVNPPSGAVVSSVSEVKVTFTRNVDLSGSASRITLKNAAGKTLANALRAEVKDNVLTIGFRTISLTSGETYKVTIPSGLVTMVGDINVSSGAIEVTYTGRSDGAVTPTIVEPAAGASMSRLDASTNCVFVRFNASIAIADGAKAELWREGDSSSFADLNIGLYDGATIVIYPTSRQYLYDGTNYSVVLPSGSVTDLSGAGANEELSIPYVGTYVRTISADDKYLFTDACQDYAGLMFYDGDQLDPGSVPASWGFTSGVPWYIVRESDTTTDMALAAHSMFSSGGKADDWCVIPQIYIPDSQCYLTLDAQSYKKNKADHLKIYIYESDKVYNTLTKEIVDDIKANGTVMLDKQLTPGESEEDLAGDWENLLVSLADYAGKNIYICLVNDNENQSAVFIDNVQVVHDMKFLISITSPSTAVLAESAPVEGVVTISSDIFTANTIAVTLLDSKKNEISNISEDGLSLGKNGTYRFDFPKELPLQHSVANGYEVRVTINGTETSSAYGTIKNMAFEPLRQVLVEEYSGRECSNCPLGFVAMENLEKLFPGQIIPVVLRTYNSDPLGSGMTNYTTYLGLDQLGAPSGIVNRGWKGYPMISVESDFRFSGEGVSLDGTTEEKCWLDAVLDLMQNVADAEITSATATCDAQTLTCSVEASARFALNSARNVNLLAIVLEDNLETMQLNGMAYYDDADLGEWGQGGSLGQRTVAITLNSVGRGVVGRTYNGTPGLFPASFTAGETYDAEFSFTMPSNVAALENTRLVLTLIDSDTDEVINSAIVKVQVENSAISEVEADLNAPVEYFDLQGRRVMEPQKGRPVIRRQGSTAKVIIF